MLYAFKCICNDLLLKCDIIEPHLIDSMFHFGVHVGLYYIRACDKTQASK